MTVYGTLRRLGGQPVKFLDVPTIEQESSKYASIVDESVAGTAYIGHTAIGNLSLASSSVWRIQRLSTVSSIQYGGWASGDDNFDKIWANRASYTYT